VVCLFRFEISLVVSVCFVWCSGGFFCGSGGVVGSSTGFGWFVVGLV